MPPTWGLLAPVLLLLPGVSLAPDGGAADDADGASLTLRPAVTAGVVDRGQSFDDMAERLRRDNAAQVRIEQRTIIRIVPRPLPLRSDMIFTLPSRALPVQLVEQRIGKCLPAGMITGVQPDGSSRLLLFMRDRTVVRAILERACRARDFYSGFYYARTGDGKLCVDRDSLLSRSGVDCKLTRIRRLVADDD